MDRTAVACQHDPMPGGFKRIATAVRHAVAIAAPVTLAATGAQAQGNHIADGEALTLRCAVVETERSSAGPARRHEHAVELSLDLAAGRYVVFEGLRPHPGQPRRIHDVTAEVIQLSPPTELVHGTERTSGTGLRLRRDDLTLGDRLEIRDPGMSVETVWAGPCRRVAFRPLPG